MSDNQLAVVEQKTVILYEDEVIAVRVADGTVYVPIKPICDNLGVQWSAQSKRIRRDPVLSEEAKGVSITDIPGGTQVMTCLPLDFISGFLFGINATRVSPEWQDKVIKYQRKCYKVLADAFMSIADAPETPAMIAYRQALAVAELARQQVMIEARLDGYYTVLLDHETRIVGLETQLGDPGRHITPDQAMQISQAVKTVALEIQKRTGRAAYGGLYGELYRKFAITSYKELPASQFARAMAWLTEEYKSLTGATGPDEVPF